VSFNYTIDDNVVTIIGQFGHIQMVEDEKGFNVSEVFVEEEHRRKGHATQLYTLAYRHAKENGKPLYSDVSLAYEPQCFWGKQVTKGCASFIIGEPITTRWDGYVIERRPGFYVMKKEPV